MAGAPVVGAFVIFSPKQQGQPVATGRTDDSGKFSLTTYNTGDGAVAGDYAVLVSKSSGATEATGAGASHDAIASGKVNPGAAHAGGGKSGAAKSESALPEKYSDLGTTTLSATVKSGEANAFDLKLEL